MAAPHLRELCSLWSGALTDCRGHRRTQSASQVRPFVLFNHSLECLEFPLPSYTGAAIRIEVPAAIQFLSGEVPMPLKLQAASECQLDVLTLGECMIRLSPPGHRRVEFAPYFESWVGGAEYNVSFTRSVAWVYAPRGSRAWWKIPWEHLFAITLVPREWTSAMSFGCLMTAWARRTASD